MFPIERTCQHHPHSTNRAKATSPYSRSEQQCPGRHLVSPVIIPLKNGPTVRPNRALHENLLKALYVEDLRFLRRCASSTNMTDQSSTSSSRMRSRAVSIPTSTSPRCQVMLKVANNKYLPISNRPYLKSVSIASLASAFEPLYFPTSKLPH